MKKYSTLMVIISFVVVILIQFLAPNYLLMGQIFILVTFVVIYFLGDNKSTEFLNKLKYSILFAILVYFFLTINIKSNTYWGVSDFQLEVAASIVFSKSIFLVYVMLRSDRLQG